MVSREKGDCLVDCLLSHCLLWIVYCRGKGENHRLGHGNTKNVLVPTLVKGLASENVVQVAMGTFNCLALTAKGEVGLCLWFNWDCC